MRKWYCLYDMFVAALISALSTFVTCSSFEFFLYFAEGTRLLSLVECTDVHTFHNSHLPNSWSGCVELFMTDDSFPLFMQPWLLLPFWALKFLLLLTLSACVYESGTFGDNFLSQLVKYMGPYSCCFPYYLYMGRVICSSLILGSFLKWCWRSRVARKLLLQCSFPYLRLLWLNFILYFFYFIKPL